MEQREARCWCGALKAICRGEPQRISICHCLACKRRTGSAFSYNATYDADQVSCIGDTASYKRISDEGHRSEAHLCATCGSVLWYEIDRRPGMITIPVGMFADPDFPEPAFAVFSERRHDWIEIRTAAPLQEQ